MSECIREAHVPVLQEEVLRYLQPTGGRVYVDCTLGLGGHGESILRASSPDGQLIGFEWDRQAAELAGRRLEKYGDRFTPVHRSYAELIGGLADIGITEVDGVLLDLGVSSLQLDRAERGFSFQVEGPLDMRMDRRQGKTAEDLIRTLSRDELADIFYNYGEERQSRRIAAYLVKARERHPVRTTEQLARLVAEAVPRKYHPKKRHVATRVFQALRIAVNRELDNLAGVLSDIPLVLTPGGRVCVITFHSIEDRMVKQAFAGNTLYRVLTAKPVEPGAEEIERNPRARSARLRVAERKERV